MPFNFCDWPLDLVIGSPKGFNEAGIQNVSKIKHYEVKSDD